MRSQKPLCLRALSFGYMSFSTLMTVMYKKISKKILYASFSLDRQISLPIFNVNETNNVKIVFGGHHYIIMK